MRETGESSKMGKYQGKHAAPEKRANRRTAAAPRDTGPEYIEGPWDLDEAPDMTAPEPEAAFLPDEPAPGLESVEPELESDGPELESVEPELETVGPEPGPEAMEPEDAPARERVRPGKEKRSKWFPVFMLFYVLVLLIGSGYLQLRLWDHLGSSQAEMDRETAEDAAQKAHEKAVFQAPQLVFEDWKSGLTIDYWTDLWYDQAPIGLDIRDQVYAYMENHFAPDAIQAYKAAEFTQETPVYVLKNGEESLARVTLSGRELDWEVSEVELLFQGTYSASVTVPSECQVRCNDQPLGEDFSQPADSLMHYTLLNEQLEGPVTWVSYSVDGLLTEPELTVEPPEGYGLLPFGDNGYLLLMEGDNSAYTDKSVQFIKTDLEYYMNGARGAWSNMNRVLTLLRRGTQAYDETRQTYEGISWSTHYSNIDTSKTYAGDVIAWADNCFSVDVTYNADCTLRGDPVDYANATTRLYFLRDGDGYFISNFETL